MAGSKNSGPVVDEAYFFASSGFVAFSIDYQLVPRPWINIFQSCKGLNQLPMLFAQLHGFLFQC